MGDDTAVALEARGSDRAGALAYRRGLAHDDPLDA